jgi:SAM-dependent methyltransferase
MSTPPARDSGTGRARASLASVVVAIVIGFDGCDALAKPPALRAPDVPYEPTPHHVVTAMLELAQVGPSDRVYDLGCGDGRIVIAAARLGARAVCVDIDPRRIEEPAQAPPLAYLGSRPTLQPHAAAQAATQA